MALEDDYHFDSKSLSFFYVSALAEKNHQTEATVDLSAIFLFCFVLLKFT